MSHICRLCGQNFSSFSTLCDYRSRSHAENSHYVQGNTIENKTSNKKLNVEDNTNEIEKNRSSSVDETIFKNAQVTDNEEEI